MNLQDLTNKKTAKTLNESLARRYGERLNLESFSTAQLRAARDKLLTSISVFEQTNHYDAVYNDSDYQKNRALLDIITQTISERTLTPSETKNKEKFVKGMKGSKEDFKSRYGKDTEGVMYGTATKMAKNVNEQILKEGEEEKAALIMSSRDMVDKLTGWLDDTASMKAERLLDLVDSIRDELGSDIADNFDNTVKPALEEVYNTLETNRQVLAHAVSIITGEEAPTLGPEVAANIPTTNIEPDLSTDEFGSAAPSAGAPTTVGREKRESIDRSLKKKV